MDKRMKYAVFATIAILVISYVVFTLTQKSTNVTTINQIKSAEQQACVGTNINRSLTNESNYLTFKGLKDSIHYTKSQAASTAAALAALGISQKLIKQSQAESDRQLANQQERYAALFWIQLADCSNPGLHTRPVVVYAFKDKLPDRSQLSIKNATVIKPIGSTDPDEGTFK
jgi:hypothetical protein